MDLSFSSGCPPNKIQLDFVNLVKGFLWEGYVLHVMVRDSIEGCFCKGCSSCKCQKVYFPARELISQVVNYKLKIQWFGPIIDNWEAQIFFKLGGLFNIEKADYVVF